jgi:STAS domain
MLAANETDGLRIRIEGVFDEPAARRVGELIAGTPSGTPVEVDLSRIREFHDHGLALLAGAVSAADGRVALRGLGRHQRRVLQYLGVAPAALGSAGGPALA